MRQFHVPILWNHRLSALTASAGHVVARVDRSDETGQGYAVPTIERLVDKTFEVQAEFVVGADGVHSMVRSLSGIAFETFGPEKLFAVYDVRCHGYIEPEIRVAFHHGTVNALWPMGEDRCRWTFQFLDSRRGNQAEAKDRVPLFLEEDAFDPSNLDHAATLIAQRAPWFAPVVKEIDWATDVSFAHRLARRFGHGRVWLAGDAAHQTDPIGMQSMNFGLREADLLAHALAEVLAKPGVMEPLAAYSRCREEWLAMLGLQARVQPNSSAVAWVSQRCVDLPSCVPATGPELARLLGQIGLDLNFRNAALAA